jgi:hypothetical protein
MQITEADRATARRVIRRMSGVGPHASVNLYPVIGGEAYGMIRCGAGVGGSAPDWVNINANWFNAAVEAAAQGRAYAAALRSAK